MHSRLSYYNWLSIFINKFFSYFLPWFFLPADHLLFYTNILFIIFVYPSPRPKNILLPYKSSEPLTSSRSPNNNPLIFTPRYSHDPLRSSILCPRTSSPTTPSSPIHIHTHCTPPITQSASYILSQSSLTSFDRQGCCVIITIVPHFCVTSSFFSLSIPTILHPFTLHPPSVWLILPPLLYKNTYITPHPSIPKSIILSHASVNLSFIPHSL